MFLKPDQTGREPNLAKATRTFRYIALVCLVTGVLLLLCLPYWVGRAFDGVRPGIVFAAIGLPGFVLVALYWKVIQDAQSIPALLVTLVILAVLVLNNHGPAWLNLPLPVVYMLTSFPYFHYAWVARRLSAVPWTVLAQMGADLRRKPGRAPNGAS